MDSDPELAGKDAAGEVEKGSKQGGSKAEPRRFPLPAGPRLRPERLTQLEADILGSVKAMVNDIEVLDRQIDEMHRLLEQLMYLTGKAVGVAWREHRTRGGLHPVAYREGNSKGAMVTPRKGRPAKRFWVNELNPPVRLSRFALGDPNDDEWLVRAQKDVLRALERFLALRARAISCLAGQRKPVAAWAQQVRPGLYGKPVQAAFETMALRRRINAEHFVKAHRRGILLAEGRYEAADAVREQDEADLAQRPR